MPLTPFQKAVARLLAQHRNPERHLTGNALVNHGTDGVRISEDLDIFQYVVTSVAASAEADARALRAAGYTVTWTLRAESIYQAEVQRGEDVLRALGMGWCGR